MCALVHSLLKIHFGLKWFISLYKGENHDLQHEAVALVSIKPCFVNSFWVHIWAHSYNQGEVFVNHTNTKSCCYFSTREYIPFQKKWREVGQYIRLATPCWGHSHLPHYFGFHIIFHLSSKVTIIFLLEWSYDRFLIRLMIQPIIHSLTKLQHATWQPLWAHVVLWMSILRSTPNHTPNQTNTSSHPII